MKALQLKERGRLALVELPVPTPKDGEVLIRTVASTICTSDLADIAHNPFNIQLPRVLGHESAGVIAETGRSVKCLRAGDKVAVHPVIPCGNCANCARHLGHLCERMGHLGYDRDGTHSEYFCVPAERVRHIPDHVDMAVSSLLEPVAVCIEAVKRVRLAKDERILVVGDGPFGIMIARLALRCQPAQVIFVGHEEFRLGQAPESLRINSRKTEDVKQAVLAATNGVGVDAAILAVADEMALDLCVQSLRARGRLGIFCSITQRTPIDLMRIHVKELEVFGVCNDENYIADALALLRDKTLSLDSIITHRVPFAEWERAFDLAANHKNKALKVTLIFPEATQEKKDSAKML